jgi:hypothetical protein
MIDDQDKIGSKIDDLDSPGFFSKKFEVLMLAKENLRWVNGWASSGFGEAFLVTNGNRRSSMG